MTVAIKNNNKTSLVVPASVRRTAGFKSGQEIEFKASGGVITILPKLPKADDEYTAAQRRIIDSQLDAAEKGPFHGPFKNADEMIAYVKGELKKRAAELARKWENYTTLGETACATVHINDLRGRPNRHAALF